MAVGIVLGVFAAVVQGLELSQERLEVVYHLVQIVSTTKVR